MEGESLILLISAISFVIIAIFVIGLGLWYFKFGGKKSIEQ